VRGPEGSYSDSRFMVALPYEAPSRLLSEADSETETDAERRRRLLRDKEKGKDLTRRERSKKSGSVHVFPAFSSTFIPYRSTNVTLAWMLLSVPSASVYWY
jgi:hypothetical protein